ILFDGCQTNPRDVVLFLNLYLVITYLRRKKMTSWVSDLIRSTGYTGIVLLMVLENIFPPIPSEVIMPLSGFLVSTQELQLLGVILSGTLGTVIGATALYYLGYILGPQRL